ncbi:uncharacterized protein [Argopecten irradians]|uniref:uncharacterized protein n=1 Tax=Argopecten irradians TaxID=31199 RepID=UPI00371F5730
MSQNGNLFKGLIGNTGNNGQGISPYNAQGGLAAMTGYGGNCPPLQGMSISKTQSSSIGYGMNPVRNSINPIQPFMGMNSGCRCTLTVNMEGCFICPCGNTVRPFPTTGVGTLMTPVPEVIDTTSLHPASTRPSSIAITMDAKFSSVSNTVSGKDSRPTQSNVDSNHENKASSGQITAQISTKQPSLLNGNIDIPNQNLSSDENTPKNILTNQPVNQNISTLSDNESDFTGERSFPLAVSLGCLFFLTCAVCCVLGYHLLVTKKQIKHQGNELYFVEKSFRQSISSNDDSMKSGRRNPPNLPSRAPPLTPTAPSVSPSGHTSFMFPPEDVRHDYLELI